MLARKAVCIKEQIYGHGHGRTAITLSKLHLILQVKGNHEEILDLERLCMSIRDRKIRTSSI